MKEFFYTQKQNILIWVAFFITIGSISYFLLPFEPNVIIFSIISLLISLFIILFKRNFLIIFLSFIFGFIYPLIFARTINTFKISHNYKNISVYGEIEDINYEKDKTKIIFKVIESKISDKPFKVKLSSNQNLDLKVGDRLIAKISLFKPNSKSDPASFDYARFLYFNSITATGFLDEYLKEENVNSDNIIKKLRLYIHKKANSFLTDSLFLGYKNTIPKEEKEVWLKSGIGHIWSISGLHITIISIISFFIFFNIFRLISPITKRFPARYPTSFITIFFIFLYLLISGSNVSTIRAVLSAFIIFVAFILNRYSVSIRTMSIVYLITYLFNPHFLMQASFQLSFSAVIGIIFIVEKIRNNNKNLKNKLKVFLSIPIISSIFTLPFLAIHFHYFPLFSLIGNIIILPIFSFIVMPLVFLGTILSLFDFKLINRFTINIYNYIYTNLDFMLSKISYTEIKIPFISNTSMLFIITGLFFIIAIINIDKNKFTKNANLIIGSSFIILGLILSFFTKKPLFYITLDHELIAVLDEDNLKFNKTKSSNHFFIFNNWKYMNNEELNTQNLKYNCKKGLCLYKTDKWTIAYTKRFKTLEKNLIKLCKDKNITYIASYFDIEAKECNKKILKDAFVIYESGKVEYIKQNRIWN